jgi:rsbT co-antagonist protein RsbR
VDAVAPGLSPRKASLAGPGSHLAVTAFVRLKVSRGALAVFPSSFDAEYQSMATKTGSAIPSLVAAQEQHILAEWLQLLKHAGGGGRIRDSELQSQCREFLSLFRQAAGAGELDDVHGPGFARLRDLLSDISRSRAAQGFSPSETATFVFSLKQPIFALLQQQHKKQADALAADTWALTVVIDQLGLYTIEAYQRSREEVIIRQQQEIAELSTPVVKLWDGVLALPLIGTLDSSRTQVVMENLLQTIVEQNAEIAIIDITGVPTVDTLVAQHLLKTVAAARLMGADCIISGIRPQIAQTMVHLGVELNVTSKASLSDALALALQRTGKMVVPAKAAAVRA